MKILNITGTTLILLLTSAISSGSMAATLDKFEADVTIFNKTPYTLELRKSLVVYDKDKHPRGEFQLDTNFLARDQLIQPGEQIKIGHSKSRKYGIAGRFLFQFKDTEESFYAHYSFDKNENGDTWFKLQDAQGHAYPLASVRMLNTFKLHRRHAYKKRSHRSSIVLSTDDAAVACINDSDCSADTFRKALVIPKGRTEL